MRRRDDRIIDRCRLPAKVMFLLLGWGVLAAGTSESIQVKWTGTGKTALLKGFRKDDVFYTAAADLAGLFETEWYRNPENHKAVIRTGSRQIVLTAMNPFIVIDGQVMQMPLPTAEIGGQIFIPLDMMLRAAGDALPGTLTFDPQSRTLTIQESFYNITGIDISEKANGTMIRVNTSKPFDKSGISTFERQGWLNLTVMDGLLDSARIASDQQTGMVRQIVPYQLDGSTQLSFLLSKKPADHDVQVDGNSIIITLWDDKPVPAETLISNGVDKKRWIIDKIIIDPGHGGRHPGAVGRSGLKEKEVTIDIANKLKALLESRLGIEVLLTRENDEFVGLKERTQFANANDGKLFISIHCNGNNDRRERGFSTWFLGKGKTDEALAVADKENSVIQFEESVAAYDEYRHAAHILNAMAQSAYMKESQDLAQIVNRELKSRTKMPQWGKGVYQAGFYVLIGAAMPSILVEAGFISNAYEEKLLRTRSFRQKIAEALYESIYQFKQKHDRDIN